MPIAHEKSHVRGPSLAALSLSAVLFVAMMPAYAAIAVPAVPLATDCKFSTTQGTVCGLYLDLSGNASAGPTAGQSYSYQPTWNYTNYLFVTDAATALSGPSAMASATDFVTFGSLKSQLNSQASGGASSVMPNTGAGTSSTIGFQDRLTFNLAGAAPGTMATMTGRLAVSGAVGAASSTYPAAGATALAQVSASGGNGLVSSSVTAYSDRPTSGGIPSYITFEAAVKFNQPYFTLVFVELRTAAQSNALSVDGKSYSAQANVDFFSSVEWAGIDSVRDANGNSIANWSVTSASGFDYSRSYAAQAAAVPEPEGYAMLLAGVGLLGLIARRRKYS